jgi:ankyrin repeat protein
MIWWCCFRRGETALHYAVRNQNKDVATLLLLHKADKFITSGEGHSAVDLARMSGFEGLETGTSKLNHLIGDQQRSSSNNRCLRLVNILY